MPPNVRRNLAFLPWQLPWQAAKKLSIHAGFGKGTTLVVPQVPLLRGRLPEKVWRKENRLLATPQGLQQPVADYKRPSNRQWAY
jgi:hypothetical protein